MLSSRRRHCSGTRKYCSFPTQLLLARAKDMKLYKISPKKAPPHTLTRSLTLSITLFLALSMSLRSDLATLQLAHTQQLCNVTNIIFMLRSMCVFDINIAHVISLALDVSAILALLNDVNRCCNSTEFP